MEKALCSGRLRMAYKVAQDEELEKEIRRASRAGEILCPDIECKAPILKHRPNIYEKLMRNTTLKELQLIGCLLIMSRDMQEWNTENFCSGTCTAVHPIDIWW